MKTNCVIGMLLLLAFACKKPTVEILASNMPRPFVTYTIAKGQHYVNNDSTNLEIINSKQLNFICKFDNSAIYSNSNKANQSDINKLYGFSDNNKKHHDFSARFGWNWLNNGLHLWAYTYNDAKVSVKDLGTVTIGSEITCSIKVLPTHYIYSVNGINTFVPRTATTANALGYKLYPYFGGDEPAPQDITILIKEL